MTWSDESPIHLPGGKGLIVDGKFNRTAEDCCCGEPGDPCYWCADNTTPAAYRMVVSGLTPRTGCHIGGGGFNSKRWTTTPPDPNGTYILTQDSSCNWRYTCPTEGSYSAYNYSTCKTNLRLYPWTSLVVNFYRHPISGTIRIYYGPAKAYRLDLRTSGANCLAELNNLRNIYQVGTGAGTYKTAWIAAWYDGKVSISPV